MSEEVDVISEQPGRFSTMHTTDHQASLNRISEEFNFALPSSSASANKNIVEETSKYTYPTQLTNSFDRENWTVSTDHCYARPWNWRPEASFLRPTKSLFVPRLIPEKRKPTHSDQEDLIDVTTGPELSTPLYDIHKARNMMEECEKHAFSIRVDDDGDWEEKISKLNWTNAQHRVFNAIINILNSYSLAKLTQIGVHNEPLLRRTVIDKAVQRVRRLLASVSWDPKITQWLHQLLIDNLDSHYLACYLDILQTLKSKLPLFVDKMMCGPNSSTRMGPLNNTNLMPLLERNWDPVISTLIQDKPKRLPGNPVIVIVPSGPVMSKMLQKWIKLLSHLATVVTIPTNFGSSSHRMGMPNILDQIFSVTKGKIQDVRNEYPGRHIVLFGFRSGATLALQIAQVESVLCVVSAGFSVWTAEGVRGEPDDNLLELQCPVLFVIGQCSSTATQENVEDLRERMRVETGLIVVGSADDMLRITKKKKKAEGISQSIVDRCIVDEVGEFISSLILSPYPPQTRQSPTNVVAESPAKKGKPERMRYNSNTSSLDSEPPSPSPTPKPRRPVGRPPGSKKNRLGLEAKWAQEIAQGNPNNPSSPSPPPPYPTTHTPDTSSTDSSQPDKQPQPPKQPQPLKPTADTTNVRKIRTLKPVIGPDKATTPTSPVKNPPSTQQARMQAYGMNRAIVPPHSSSLSTLLQGGIKTIPPSQPKSSSSGIKVLENVTLNSSSTAKLFHNRTIDLSKITLINSVKGTSGSMNNVLLLPDGKLKSMHGSTVKGTGGTPILLPLSPQKAPPKRNKYITAKRQQKAAHMVKKPFYMPATNIQAPLPPPTNLTSEDIMDLPIIFADDNQILDTQLNTTPTSNISTATIPSMLSKNPPPLSITPSTAKYLLVNKQQASQGNLMVTPNIKKQQSPMAFNKTPKYTKIILSKKASAEEPRTRMLSPEITIKKIAKPQSHNIVRTEPPPVVELIDLENEIRATAVPKPYLSTSDIKNIKIISKSAGDTFGMNFFTGERPSGSKRPPSVVEITDDGDPDYIPPKNIKLQ
ncbi:unnamed protein product [Phaedon cochleariae]|uniref:KANSL3 helical domain-containing protein n=1 Tax=Phaedon cochleariae TaxID=80249 RepID=A0A9P0DHK5_PHACE|nr:unnamed protein product [Phaedon cochleariae]